MLEADAPASRTMSRTVYVDRRVVKVFETLIPAPVFPSPKFQDQAVTPTSSLDAPPLNLHTRPPLLVLHTHVKCAAGGAFKVMTVTTLE